MHWVSSFPQKAPETFACKQIIESIIIMIVIILLIILSIIELSADEKSNFCVCLTAMEIIKSPADSLMNPRETALSKLQRNICRRRAWDLLSSPSWRLQRNACLSCLSGMNKMMCADQWILFDIELWLELFYHPSRFTPTSNHKHSRIYVHIHTPICVYARPLYLSIFTIIWRYKRGAKVDLHFSCYV